MEKFDRANELARVLEHNAKGARSHAQLCVRGDRALAAKFTAMATAIEAVVAHIRERLES